MKKVKKAKAKQATSEAVIGEYQGKPVIKLFNLDDEGNRLFPITFGKKKAELILKHLNEIKAFVEEE